MKINFIPEDDNYFAIASEEIYNGFHCQELMFAEISPLRDKFVIRYEDDFRHPVTTNSLLEAKQHVLLNYERHVPTINGRSYEVGED